MNDKYISITRLNNYIKSLFDNNPPLQKVYLKGEISNFKNHTRGHLYFTLKDENSRLSAVMFASNTHSLSFKPEDGQNVLVEGRISCYPAQGSYQIYVEKMELDGIGNLYIEYEKLKKKLASEGLFDDKYKKVIPKYPTKIGVITAPTGAAIKDILSTIKRRYPICETILFPCLVQGKDAAPDIVRQLKVADTYNLDVIICGRGGGSIEDLWAFNEEIVARKIFDMNTPVISAVGHEIDFTIADYVADLRAPTPTGAAEMAVPTISDVNYKITQLTLRSNEFINNLIKLKSHKLNAVKESYILKNPLAIYEIKEQKLDNYIDKLNKYIKQLLLNKKHELVLNTNTLKLVNPLNILDKGYSLVTKDDVVIKNVENLKINDTINIRFYKGNIKAEVKEIE
jgi:exodeoxyribonuclease VII large subunit